MAVGVALIGCGGSDSSVRASSGGGQGTSALSPELARWALGAVRFSDLGDHHRAVTTRSPDAQGYFDQGLRLLYAFNHDEAARSFVKAAAIDPSCAMCFWGASLALGPNYNMVMLPDRARPAWEALQLAQREAPKASPVEQALIEALATRYPGPDPVEPPALAPHLEAYARAMEGVARRFPEDVDVQTLYAESLMMLSPWRLWTPDGKPAPQTGTILTVLEGVLERAPQHAGANHYYIHAVEASPEPQKGMDAAARLPRLMPGAGHLVHMPAHIYQRTGRYEAAADANRQAIAADERYLQQTSPPGYYPMYVGHNRHFLAFSDAYQGKSREALSAARSVVTAMPLAMASHMPGMDYYAASPLFVMARFGDWDGLLAEPRPDARYPALHGIWLFAHGLALAEKGRLDEAEGDRAALVELTSRLPAGYPAGQSLAKDVLEIGARVVEARIARKKGDRARAVALLTEAVEREDELAYDEPADWFYPVRHVLGAELLAAGRARDAEAVYREDLRRNPENGWSLLGLSQALTALGRAEEARAVQQRFERAWENADVRITSSAY